MKIKIEFEGTHEEWDKFICRQVTVVNSTVTESPKDDKNENKIENSKSNNKRGGNAFEKVENI